MHRGTYKPECSRDARHQRNYKGGLTAHSTQIPPSIMLAWGCGGSSAAGAAASGGVVCQGSISDCSFSLQVDGMAYAAGRTLTLTLLLVLPAGGAVSCSGCVHRHHGRGMQVGVCTLS
jgi:hypothetical protein